MGILLTVHLWLRWAVILFGLVGALRIILSARNADRLRRVNKADGILFMAALDLTWVVGAVLLAINWNPDGNNQSLLHGGIMTAAVFLGHGLRVRAKRHGAGPFLMALSFLGPLAVVLGGHTLLP